MLKPLHKLLGKAVSSSLYVVLFFLPFFTVFCHAQCYQGPPSSTPFTMSPQYWAPGQTYNVTVVITQGSFGAGSGHFHIITSASYYQGNYSTDDPNVTVSNFALVNPSEISFTVTLAPNAPTEQDAWTLLCVGNFFVTQPSIQITPCANPVTPTISSVQPAAFFAGTSTNLTITGSGFITGNPPDSCVSSQISVWSGSENMLTDYTINSPTQITATVAPQAGDPAETASVQVSNYIYNSKSWVVSKMLSAEVLPVPAIQWNNSTISGANAPTQSAVVGQPINLTVDPATTPSDISISQNKWTVGGINIGAYTPASAPTVVTPTDLTQITLDTYWPYPSTRNSPFQITYQYCVNVQGLTNPCSPTATAKFNVAGPTGKITTKTTGPSVNLLSNCTPPPPNFAWLAFGQISNQSTTCDQFGTPGVTFTGSVKSQPSSGGLAEWIQVLSQNQFSLISSAGTSNFTCGIGLDNAVPYPASSGLSAQDSPGFGITPVTYTGGSRVFSAAMFLMWQSSIAGSIPVPLASVQWQFNIGATGNTSGTSWSLNAGSSGSANPYQTITSGTSPSFGFPTWSSVAINGQCGN